MTLSIQFNSIQFNSIQFNSVYGVLQTQDSKFGPWRSEAEHATSRSRRLPTILTFTRGWGRNIFCFFQTAETGNWTPNSGVKGSGANHYTRAPAILQCHATTHMWYTIPMNTRHPPNVGLILAHRLRRWANINPTLGGCLVFAGIYPVVDSEIDRRGQRQFYTRILYTPHLEQCVYKE